MMDNAGLSGGVQLILGPGIQPGDGKFEIVADKIWIATGDVDDVRKAFEAKQLANCQPQLEKIIRLASEFIDRETGIPTVFQGEKAELPETLGATNIVVDSANVALRGRVKLWDDDIVTPSITRLYHYNMQYSENNEIKGDYNVRALGATVLLERDAQRQAALHAFAVEHFSIHDDLLGDLWLLR
jgi:hypothetical protein